MNRINRNQKGFGAVEGLLILVIVGLLGFVGWYVYHTKNATDSTYNGAARTSSTNANKTTSSTNQAKYLNIPELGIKLKLGAGADDATYAKLTEPTTGLSSGESIDYGFSTKALEAIGPGCNASTGNVGFIEVVSSPTTMVSYGAGQDAANKVYPSLTQVGSKYYALGTGNIYQGTCDPAGLNNTAYTTAVAFAKQGFKATIIEKF